MFAVPIGSYELLCTSGKEPDLFEMYIERTKLFEDINDSSDQYARTCFIAVYRHNQAQAALTLKLTYEPAGGVYPSVLLVEETNVLFVGAGETLLAYQLNESTKLWHDTNDSGFHGWERHGNFVLMSAELEVAAWDIHGKKLWSMFAEPPYDFKVRDGIVYMNRMDEQLIFPIHKGPKKWRYSLNPKER